MARRSDSGAGGRRPTRRASRRGAAPAPDGRPVDARVLTVEDRCWQCRSKVRGIVGVLVAPELTRDRSGFLPFDDVADALAATLDPRALAARRIGELKHRDSPGIAGGYISNGCAECDALIGRFRLEDLLHEHRMAGGTPAQLDIGIAVELRLAAAPRLRAIR